MVSDIVLHAPFSGTELTVALRGVCPSVPVLLVSGTPVEGWSDNDLSQLGALAAGPVEFLMKPFTAEDVHRSLAMAEDLLRGRETLRPKLPDNLTIYEAEHEPELPEPGYIPSKLSLRTRLEHWIAGYQHSHQH